MIEKRRIRNVKINLLGINQDEQFYVVKKLSEVTTLQLEILGFPKNFQEGDSLLAKVIGPVSRFNVYGSYIRLKHLPKETKYREICIKNWQGDFQYVDIPYKRYQRKVIPAPEIELSIQRINDELYIISPLLNNNKENENHNRHIINLFLEYFGDCDIFNSKFQTAFQQIPIHRVNWEILPPGERIWEDIPKDGIKVNGPCKAKLQKHTFETINKYHPQSISIGSGGFLGYIVFQFTNKNIFLLEHLLYGNATYVFENSWEEFSKLSKGQIITSHLQRERLIHKKGWEKEIDKLLA